MVFGFWLFWPLGFVVLAFALGSGRMGCWRGRDMSRWHQAASMRSAAGTWWQPPQRSSGNKAFDDYRTETLRRLEDEQREFHDFLDRLRNSKDKVEFDQFMAERRNRPNPEAQPQG
jgi:hypothetical protein